MHPLGHRPALTIKTVIPSCQGPCPHHESLDRDRNPASSPAPRTRRSTRHLCCQRHWQSPPKRPLNRRLHLRHRTMLFRPRAAGQPPSSSTHCESRDNDPPRFQNPQPHRRAWRRQSRPNRQSPSQQTPKLHQPATCLSPLWIDPFGTHCGLEPWVAFRPRTSQRSSYPCIESVAFGGVSLTRVTEAPLAKAERTEPR